MTQAHVIQRTPLDADVLLHVTTIMRRSFDVEKIHQDGHGVSVTVLDDIPVAELEYTLKQVLLTCRYAVGDTLFRRTVLASSVSDPQPLLEAKGEVQSIGPGLFAYRGDFLRVRTALDVKIKSLAHQFGADELSYPPLWPVSLLQDINYFHDFPQLVLVPSGIRSDYQARSVFADRFRKSSGNTVIACSAENGFATAQHALAPTVCDCCYWLLRNRRDVSNKLFTIHGQVFRNESSFDNRLDRLTVYTMREIVMVGHENYVLEKRNDLLDEVEKLIVGLDLACNVKAADDPFFCNDALQKSAFQNLAQLKYEVEVPLFGDRTTAVASINLHNDFFSKSYDYEDSNNRRCYSACVGFGYERLAYALFCRHGAELGIWPESVVDYLELS